MNAGRMNARMRVNETAIGITRSTKRRRAHVSGLSLVQNGDIKRHAPTDIEVNTRPVDNRKVKSSDTPMRKYIGRLF